MSKKNLDPLIREYNRAISRVVRTVRGGTPEAVSQAHENCAYIERKIRQRKEAAAMAAQENKAGV